MEGEDGDFGGAVQAEGHAYRAEASVDVELHLVEAEEAFGIPGPMGGSTMGPRKGRRIWPPCEWPESIRSMRGARG